VALLAPVPLTRYADVALLAACVLDHELAQSVIDIYLTPLNEGRDGGVHLRDTLLAYFAAGHQIASAAARLGVDRGTLRKRLTAIEERLGYALHTRQAELEIAMRLAALYGTERSTASGEAPLTPEHTMSHQNAGTGV
jgi:DNA-binding PucR family transcriptional regulator